MTAKRSPAQLDREIAQALALNSRSRAASDAGTFETEAERVARTNGWTVAYAAGWLDGRTQAQHGQRRDPSLQTAKDDYARGYSLGYSEVQRDGGPTKAHATKAPTNREGLTWEEWRNAARVSARQHTDLSPGLIKAWRSEWRKGTDPTDMGTGHATRKAAPSSLTPAQRAYVSLFEQDVGKHPEAYKETVRTDPAAYALQVIDGLDDEDVRQFTRDLRAEMRLASRHTSHSTKKTALRWNPAVRGRGEVTARSGYRAFVQPGSAGKWHWEVKPVGYEMLDPKRSIGAGTASSKSAAKAAASQLLLSQLS